jgi:hypothetical protein
MAQFIIHKTTVGGTSRPVISGSFLIIKNTILSHIFFTFFFIDVRGGSNLQQTVNLWVTITKGQGTLFQ